MISASTLNSELINKIAQDFAQATSLAVVVVNIHGDEISELFNFTPFCQLMRQHPEHSGRCRMSDRCGGLEASKKDQLCIYRCGRCEQVPDMRSSYSSGAHPRGTS